jgi:glycosyltransferase involved in cell wall biosynthesis
LLIAAERLASERVNVRIAGDGRLRAAVERAEEGLDNVHYHGVVQGTAKDDFLEQCDIGVAPSVWPEPGGPTHALVEWLAAGRPTLVSQRGGLTEATPSLGGAIPIEPTAQAIVSGVEALLEPAAWREALARTNAGPTEAMDEWVDRHVAIYRSLS